MKHQARAQRPLLTQTLLLAAAGVVVKDSAPAQTVPEKCQIPAMPRNSFSALPSFPCNAEQFDEPLLVSFCGI